MSNGRDPLEARQRAQEHARQIPKFGAYALALVDRIEVGFSNAKHRQQRRNTLTTYCQPIWTRRIDEVDTKGVLDCLTPIWTLKPETASFKPAIHFGAKLRLPRLHAFVAHRLVLGGVRLDLRAVERDMSQLRQTGFFRQLQHLQKQLGQRRQMTLPEVGGRAEIGRVVRDDHHEIDPLGAGLRDPPRGIKTRAIGIEQQGRHHARIEWRLTKPAFIACDDLRQIQVLARQGDDELRRWSAGT